MGGEDWEVRREVNAVISKRTSLRDSRRIMLELDEIMKSKDGPEFVRLMQKWLAVR